MGHKREVSEPIARLAYTVDEAAEALGVGRTLFLAEIAPDLRCVRIGRKKLFRVAELDGWLAKHQALTLEAA